MSVDFLAGSWIYRSFRNLPEILPRIDPDQPNRDDLAKWSRYLFGQGEMELRPGYDGSLAGTFVMGPQLEMDLSGSIIQDNNRTTLLWHAIGRSGQQSDGWIYQYQGDLVPNWVDGKRQTDAIVGTVVRSVGHDDLAPLATTDRIAPSGAVVSFVMVRKRFREARELIALPGLLLQKLSSKHHRLHHLLWHFTRNFWTTLTPKQQAAITERGWQPPRPQQPPVRGTVASREKDNGAGEDFLFMHREMLLDVRRILAANNLPPIESWKDIPKPNRSSDNADGFAVPPNWSRPKLGEFKVLEMIKSDSYMLSRMSFLERRFKDPEYLRTLTLDQLGAKLELQIHNQMHTRWASQPLDPLTLQPLPEGRERYDVSDKWSEPFIGPDGKAAWYDDLYDEYCSHVHPVFWRLHGWIDDRIEDWAKAHGNEVSRKVVKEVSWFEKGRWVRVADPWVRGTNHDHRTMEQVLRILSGKDPEAPSSHMHFTGLKLTL